MFGEGLGQEIKLLCVGDDLRGFAARKPTTWRKTKALPNFHPGSFEHLLCTFNRSLLVQLLNCSRDNFEETAFNNKLASLKAMLVQNYD